jgi:putative Holliday junction resolvase
MKLLALDLGDKWVGSAISDALGITCKPYKTVTHENLSSFLQETLEAEEISKVIVGLPTTFKGKESKQTKKIIFEKKKLEKKFNTIDHRNIEWILWDERLSSKRAHELKHTIGSKKDKMASHSIAAAFILQSYLDKIFFQKK